MVGLILICVLIAYPPLAAIIVDNDRHDRMFTILNSPHSTKRGIVPPRGKWARKNGLKFGVHATKMP